MRRAGILLFVLFLSSLTYAQPCPEEPCPPGGDGTPPVPLAGVELLVAAGALIGLRYFKRKER